VPVGTCVVVGGKLWQSQVIALALIAIDRACRDRGGAKPLARFGHYRLADAVVYSTIELAQCAPGP